MWVTLVALTAMIDELVFWVLVKMVSISMSCLTNGSVALIYFMMQLALRTVSGAEFKWKPITQWTLVLVLSKRDMAGGL